MGSPNDQLPEGNPSLQVIAVHLHVAQRDLLVDRLRGTSENREAKFDEIGRNLTKCEEIQKRRTKSMQLNVQLVDRKQTDKFLSTLANRTKRK